MPRIPSIGNYPPKFNNNASATSTKFLKQASDHTTKGLPSSEHWLGNTKVRRREFVFFINLVDAIEKGSKVLVDSINLI